MKKEEFLKLAKDTISEDEFLKLEEELKDLDLLDDELLKKYDHIINKKETKKHHDSNNHDKRKKSSKEDKLYDEINRLKKELEDYKKEYLKEVADMQNTKRRLKEESINDRKYSSLKLISELINPIDMLNKILDTEPSNPEVKNYQIGFQMIAKQITDILEQDGLKIMNVSVGDEFNPSMMQAIDHIEDDTVTYDQVSKILKKGYMYKDRIISPCMVEIKIKNKKEKGE